MVVVPERNLALLGTSGIDRRLFGSALMIAREHNIELTGIPGTEQRLLASALPVM